MTDQPIVFKATYSNVAVYEVICRDIAVMRRRGDGYVNATQILKVAEFGKAQRTRILEREVQTGIHEKIQGGYGKYQGTWIPLERGKDLARRYDVFGLLSPLLMFQPGIHSPPLAPKHTTATSYKPKTLKEPKLTKKQKVLLEMQKQQLLNPYPPLPLPVQGSSRARAFVGQKRPPPNYDPPPGIALPPSCLYNSNRSNSNNNNEDNIDDETNLHQYISHSAPMSPSEVDEDMDDIITTDPPTYHDDGEPYDVQLLRHFISGDKRVPSLLIHPPADLDFNIIIDDEGHTSLHWAAAIGHLKIVKLLLHHGADLYRVNYKGQTALIRAVLFNNNFERRCFPHMLEMLRKTIFNIDKKDQTVFHHIASTAGWRGKVQASRYYMDCLMDRIKSQQEDLVQILNVQDVYGDTALTIAARIGNKKLVRLLVETGANTQLMNEAGKTPQDYILELDGSNSLAYQHSGPGENIRKRARRRIEQALQTTDTNQDNDDNDTNSPLAESISHTHQYSASPVIRDIGKVVDECINSYERDQEHKDQLLREARVELEMVEKRVEMTNATMRQLVFDSTARDAAESDAIDLQRQLHQVMEYTQMVRLQQFIKQYEEPIPSSSLNDETTTSSFLSTSTIYTPSVNNRTSSARTSIVQTSSSPSSPDSATSTPTEQRLKQLVEHRQQLVKEILTLQAQTPNKRYQDYKRLISMCCNVNYENVDLMLSPLLASFGQTTMDQ
ncbi:hypothetical protein BC941DRAFT_438615 [Chlamydoabsidia padenii]|nr:hypothetical protein BC941DRAFT_438615 [Chlamydoabsidia padenii]